MSVQIEKVELDGLRASIDDLIVKALYFMNLEKGEGPIFMLEHYGKTAAALFRAANSIMNSQGVLYDEYMHRKEWVDLRRLGLIYNKM